MEYDFIRQRITQLREQKGIAEYRMSMELGHSRNYIHNITNGKSKPSIEEFLYICEYLGVTPAAFFDEDNPQPLLTQQAIDGIRSTQRPLGRPCQPHTQGFIATTILIQLGGCAPEIQGDASASTCPNSVQWF